MSHIIAKQLANGGVHLHDEETGEDHWLRHRQDAPLWPAPRPTAARGRTHPGISASPTTFEDHPDRCRHLLACVGAVILRLPRR